MNNEKQKIVPQLRFPEFENDEEWDIKSLGEVTKFSQGIQVSLDVQKKTASKGYIKFLRIENYTQNSQDFRFIPVELSSNKIINKDEIAIVRYGATAGFICKGLEGVLANNLFKVSPDRKVLLEIFLYQVLKSDKTRQYFQSVMRGGAMPALSFKIVSNLLIKIPSLLEQQKIANCLSSLDNVIIAEIEKLDLLRDHKKGLLQQLFPAEGETQPKFRFPEFRYDEDWEETTLDDVADYENGKAHEKEISETGKYKVVNSKFISTNGEVVKFTNSANLKANVGDILMVLSDIPNGKAIAKCFYVDKVDTYTVNQRICKITPTDINNKFLFYVQNRNKYFLAFDDGVKQTNLRKDTVLSFPFLKPKDPKEQEKIAECLTLADDLITEQANKIESLQEHKKGLLQQLFPNVNELAI